MTQTSFMPPSDCEDAVARLAEISRLYVSIRRRLDQMIQTLGETDVDTPKAIVTKLNELHAAHLRVLAAEEAFHDQNPKGASGNTVDFAALRTDIGGKLDRLRDVLATDGFSGQPDQG